ncbi:hypothetical protein HK100_001272 [Physocladia obscura]|uniref:BZIP domain-containing protein n=1 Tax=Physocladia obscura TaxID=109957 RepID=A0AAD5XEM8_9FUNG|nr:hypothetical protein HK100_001272 [Physocladia obscura]
MYNPNSGRGRRRTNAQPATNRAAQLREAQRVHRERKQTYIKQLEAKAARADELEAICAALSRRLLALAASLPALSDPADAPGNSNAQSAANQPADDAPIASPSAATDTFPSTASHSDDWLESSLPDALASREAFVSAALLYGPIELEFARILLTNVPSLEDSPLIGRFIDATNAAVDSSDRRELRKNMMLVIASSQDILDACGVIERQKVLETFALIKMRNKDINAYIHQMMLGYSTNTAKSTEVSDSLTPPRSANSELKQRQIQSSTTKTPITIYERDKSSPLEAPFRDILNSIKSLDGAQDLIDDLCDVYYSISIDGKYEERFFKLWEITHTLSEMCSTIEDRIKLMISLEIGRGANREHIQNFIQQIKSIQELALLK